MLIANKRGVGVRVGDDVHVGSGDGVFVEDGVIEGVRVGVFVEVDVPADTWAEVRRSDVVFVDGLQHAEIKIIITEISAFCRGIIFFISNLNYFRRPTLALGVPATLTLNISRLIPLNSIQPRDPSS